MNSDNRTWSITLNEKSKEYVKAFMESHKIKHKTKAIEKIVEEHEQQEATIIELKEHSCQDTSLETTSEIPSKEEWKKSIQENNPPYEPCSESIMEDIVLASGTWIKEEKADRQGYQYRYIGNWLSNPSRKGKAWANKLHSLKEAYHYADVKRKMQNKKASSEKTIDDVRPQPYICAYANQTFRKLQELPCVIDINMVCPNKKCQEGINSLFR